MDKKKNQDIFAQIAASETNLVDPPGQRRDSLVEPQPPTIPQRYLPTEPWNMSAAFQPLLKLDSSEKLSRELESFRLKYASFMHDLAPEPEHTRIILPLNEFDWRLQKSSEWERVHIPHYGRPLGRATVYYRTLFDVSAAMLAKGTLWICFKGVDYKANVFVNGEYIGSHEGFFAPFEFEFTNVACTGQNEVIIGVENDAICMGNDSWGEEGSLYEGDKLYAATGPGYDDPEIGWHHCPPGMGVYQEVRIEARSSLHIRDIFVRPLLEKAAAEAWIEVYNTGVFRREVSIELSLFGQNFEQTIFSDVPYDLAGEAAPSVNYYRLPFEIPNPRVWDLETPWLHQLQVSLLDENGQTADIQSNQFGMRSFRMEEDEEPKGRFFLNGREIRLRGANTMGHLQQCVIKKDWDQLRDDILLAKISHLNFFRLTQRPVQPEIYNFCDRLGILTQTDLPIFGMLRRNQFSEAVRQAEEMERLVRSHPCNIMVTYINEPFANGGGKLHRHLSRPELESFFVAANQMVYLANPDRVIKPIDGDYDPPGPGLPDNHCYCGWYNGHGVDLGKLHKGYWQKVKPGWNYGCGEFGSEGLDPLDVMRKYYPEYWLPQTVEEEESWLPDRIVKAQTGRFHYMWFDTQHSLVDWVKASQAHQAWVTRLMTEAFRRDNCMSSFAIHLLIDAFPSGWMKAIMDVERKPKPAYFAYREALTPLMVNLRTDRTAFTVGEEISLEVWIFNDLASVPENASLHYQLELGDEIIGAQSINADVSICSSQPQGYLRLQAPQVKERSSLIVRLALVAEDGEVLHDSDIKVDVYPPLEVRPKHVTIIGKQDGNAAVLAQELGLEMLYNAEAQMSDLILIDDIEKFNQHREEITLAVNKGSTAVFVELPPGQMEVVGSTIEIVPCGMNPRHFVSRATGHSLVDDFTPNDFRFWFDSVAGYVTPLLETTFKAPDWTPILVSGNGGWTNDWGPSLAAAEKTFEHGLFRICQVSLAGRTKHNPAAKLFALKLLNLLKGEEKRK